MNDTTAKPDWNTETDDYAAPTAPVETVTAPTKPAVIAHQSTPGLVLPNPQVPPFLKDSDEKSEPAKPDFSKLPTTAKEITERLRYRRPPYTEEEKELRRRFFEMQQVPKALEIDNNLYRAEQHRAFTGAQAARIAGQEMVLNALAADEFEKMPVTPKRDIGEILKRVLAEPEMLSRIANVRRVGCGIALKCFQNWGMANPKRRLEEIARQLHGCTDMELMQQLHEESMLLSNAHSELIAGNIRAALSGEFNLNLKPLLAELMTGAIVCVERYKQEVVNAEKTFFATQGVSHEPTAVSRKYDAALSDLRHHLAAMTNPPVTMHINQASIMPMMDDTILTTVWAVALVE